MNEALPAHREVAACLAALGERPALDRGRRAVQDVGPRVSESSARPRFESDDRALEQQALPELWFVAQLADVNRSSVSPTAA